MCYPVIKYDDITGEWEVKHVGTLEEMVDPRINRGWKLCDRAPSEDTGRKISKEIFYRAVREGFTLDYYKNLWLNFEDSNRNPLAHSTLEARQALITFLEEQLLESPDFPVYMAGAITEVSASSNSFRLTTSDLRIFDYDYITEARSSWDSAFTRMESMFDSYMGNQNNKIKLSNLPVFMTYITEATTRAFFGQEWYNTEDGGRSNDGHLYKVLELIENNDVAGFKVDNYCSTTVIFNSVVIDRSQYYDVRNYTYDIVKAHPYTLSLENDASPLFYGVELEVSTDHSVREIVDAPSTFFLIATSDSSVTGNRSSAIELVTLPATLKAHKQHWGEIFKDLGYSGFDCSSQTTNGMHVHIDRKHFFDDTHLKNFVWFIMNPNNHQFISEIGERDDATEINSYCQYLTPSTCSDMVNKSNLWLYRNCMEKVRALGKNSRVNLSKSKTVEARLFKGFVSYATIVKNLEFLEAVYYFSISRSYSTNTLRNFLDYLKETPTNRYSTLKVFIEDLDIEASMVRAEIIARISRLRSPKQIREQLNSIQDIDLRISVVEHMAASMDSEYSITMDENNQVMVMIKNRSKLFELDNSLAVTISRLPQNSNSRYRRLT